MAHRLELAYKSALSNEALYSRLSDMLSALYAHYHKSPLNRSSLKAAYEELSIRGVLPSRVSGTRWMPHLLKALHAFITRHPAIMLHLTQTAASADDGKAKAMGLLATLRRRDIIELAHFMVDVLVVLGKLSLLAQTSTATLAETCIPG